MKRILVIVAILVGLLAVALGVAVARLDPEALGQAALRRVNRQEGVEVSADSFRLDVFEGLELVGADVRVESASGLLTAQIEKAVLEHELWPLLRGRVVVHRLVLESPRVEQVSKAAGAGTGGRGGGQGRPADERQRPTAPDEPSTTSDAEAPTGGASRGLDIDVELVRITDGSLVMRSDDPSAEALVIGGLDLELRDIHLDSAVEDVLLALEAEGTLRATEVQAGSLALNNAEGNLSLSGGEARLDTVDLEALNGRLKIDSLTADLSQDPFPYDLAVEGSVDLNALLGKPDGGFGDAALQLEAAGKGPELAQMRGNGVLALAEGILPAVDMVTKLEALLGNPILTGKHYEASDLVFHISGNRFDFDPFTLTAEMLELGTEGWVDMAGPIGLALSVGAPREMVEVREIPRELLDGLTDENGLTRLYFKVGGTLEQSDVSLDMGHIQSAAKAALRGVVDQHTEELRSRAEEEVDRLKRGAADSLLRRLGGRRDDE